MRDVSRKKCDMNYYLVKYILPYYFLFSALDASLYFFGFTVFAKFSMIYLVCCILMVLYKFSYWDVYDILIMISLFLLGLIGYSKNIDPRLFNSGVRYQLLLTTFFFIGKYYSSSLLIIEKGKVFFFFMAIIGLLLYIYEPAWYIGIKTNLVSLDMSTQTNYYETMRLSGFSSYPYWISYGSIIYFVYYMIRICYENYGKKKTLYHYLIIFFLVIIMFLCAQRAPLLVSLFLFVIILSRAVYKGNIRYLFISLSFIIPMVVFFSFWRNHMEDDMIHFTSEKYRFLDGGAMELVENRANMFISKKDITFTGEGIGLYSHTALSLGKKAITDQQYLRIIYESGVLGFLFYVVFFVTICYHGLKDLKKNLFEVFVIVFYLISMFGANSLSMEGYHTAIFWICCGRIFRKK